MNSSFVHLKDNLTSTAATLAANILTGGGKTPSLKVDTSFNNDQLQTLQDIDVLITDCNSFIRSCETSGIPISNAMANHVPGLNKLNVTYNHILPRMSQSEMILRSMIMEALEKKQQLKDEGKKFYGSLSLCIEYNEDGLHNLEGPIETIRYIRLTTKHYPITN